MERWREPWIEQDKRTKNWFVRWRERQADGTLHKRSVKCESHSDAVKRRGQKRDELLVSRNSANDPQAELAPLYKVYMREMENVRRLRPGALKCKREGLAHLLAKCKLLGEISRDSLKDLRDEMLATHLSPISVAIRLREVKAFVRWLHFEGHLLVNPWVKIELPSYEPSPRFLTNKELNTLEAVCKGPMLAIVRMAYLTGMRQNELLTARWEDISWIKGRGYLTVQATTAKTRRSRTIPLREEVVKLLGSRGAGQIFNGWDRHNLRWAWLEAKKAAGFTDRIRFHDLRHTFCRLYLEGGGTIADLMQITGHQSIVMMRVYANFEVKYKAARMDAINLPSDLEQNPTGQLQDSKDTLEVIEGSSDSHEVTNDDEISDDDDENDAGSCAVI